MVHTLTYYVVDDELHFDVWMGFPETANLSGFSFYQFVNHDPPVTGFLEIAYTNANPGEVNRQDIGDVPLETG